MDPQQPFTDNQVPQQVPQTQIPPPNPPAVSVQGANFPQNQPQAYPSQSQVSPQPNQQSQLPSQAVPQVQPVSGQIQPQAAQQDKEQMAAAKSNPNSTQNTLMIAEIRDGIVIMNDGSYRAVVMTKSINFDLMSPQEREAVEYSFQGFLNSLYFDIQIFIRSQKVDMRPYLDKLNKLRGEQENMLLGLLMEDYIEFISSLTVQTNIMDKKFYIVIPYSTEASAQLAVQTSKRLFGNLFKKNDQVIKINEDDLTKAKTELKNRVQAVVNGLIQMGLQAVPLDTEELIELYYDAYNPDTATKQQLTNVSDLEAPVVSKGEGEAPQPALDRELK